MNTQQLRGLGVALITPFKNDRIDFDALEVIIENQIAGKVDYLVPLGTTGEAVTLSTQECRAVMDFTIKINAGRLPIVCGMFGGNRTDYLIERIKLFNYEGIDAVLSSSPSYSKPSQEGIYQHYMAIADACPSPIIIYNVPSRTGSNVLPDTVIRLANDNSKFIGIKEATGDINQGSQLLKMRPEGFLVLSGDDVTAPALISCGGDGVISVIANAIPKLFAKCIHAALEGDFKTASRIHLQLLDVHPWLYVEGNPVGIKAAMELLGVCNRDVRLPIAALSNRNLLNLEKELIKANVLPKKKIEI